MTGHNDVLENQDLTRHDWSFEVHYDVDDDVVTEDRVKEAMDITEVLTIGERERALVVSPAANPSGTNSDISIQCVVIALRDLIRT